jgi:hypothetical protein
LQLQPPVICSEISDLSDWSVVAVGTETSPELVPMLLR